jgi:dihydrofolate reductase
MRKHTLQAEAQLKSSQPPAQSVLFGFMRTVRFSAAISLDGYIADPDGGYDWIVMDPEIDFKEMFKRYDAVLMGRKSYEMSKSYGMPGPKAYVFSRTLRQADDATVSSDVKKTVTELKKAKGKDIWLFGGGELFKSMLELKLVDALEVAVIPVLLGGGLPLLPKTKARATLVLTSQRLFKKTGTVLLNYDLKY